LAGMERHMNVPGTAVPAGVASRVTNTEGKQTSPPL